jgi:hypothetical protein
VKPLFVSFHYVSNFVVQSETIMQKSEYKGVGWSSTHEKWYAEYNCKKKKVFLGFFTDPAEAALVYDTFACEHGGRCFNFPEYVKVTITQKEEESRKKRRLLAEEMRLIPSSTSTSLSAGTDSTVTDVSSAATTAFTLIQRSETKRHKLAKLKNESQKKCYTSKYRGVSWNTERKAWKTTIQLQGKKKYVGKFQTAEEAALAYNAVAVELFGENAILNKVDVTVQTKEPDYSIRPSFNQSTDHEQRGGAGKKKQLECVNALTDCTIDDIERDFEELNIPVPTNGNENDEVKNRDNDKHMDGDE